MIDNPKLSFCEKLIYLQKQLIRFDDRPYLPAIYAAKGNLVLRASRQVEKSTLLANTILYEAVVHPGTVLLFVAPREEQSRFFIKSRLIPTLKNSPLIRRVLLGESQRSLQVRHMIFENGSQLLSRAAYRSADPARGISANLVCVDEFQDIASGEFPVLMETLSHAPDKRVILAGTPKMIDNHLEAVFQQSTACEWIVPCLACGSDVMLDERAIGPQGITCPNCQCLVDVHTGRWVAGNPGSTWGDGFCVSHPMVSWVDYEGILERQRNYDLATFKNEALGLPTTEGDLVVTRGEMERCCSENPMAQSLEDVPSTYRDRLVAGIDWGGGTRAQTAIAIGYVRPDLVFVVCHLARLKATAHPTAVLDFVAELCEKFQVRWVAADGAGNGRDKNYLLVDRMPYKIGLYGIHYSAEDHEPSQAGALCRWTVGRTKTIGHLMSCIKDRKLVLPCQQEFRPFMDEFVCERAIYDVDNRSIKYTHPTTQPDDSLHATNYALLLAVRAHHLTHS